MNCTKESAIQPKQEVHCECQDMHWLVVASSACLQAIETHRWVIFQPMASQTGESYPKSDFKINVTVLSKQKYKFNDVTIFLSIYPGMEASFRWASWNVCTPMKTAELRFKVSNLDCLNINVFLSFSEACTCVVPIVKHKSGVVLV